MTPLFVEVNRWAGLRFSWGVTDCVMLAADWVHRVRGVDPAADLRMTYASMGECQRVTRFFTDPVGLIGPRMAALDIPITQVPRRGDVGLVLLPMGGQAVPHAGLCLGENWAVRIERGVECGRPGKILAAWEVGYVDP